MRLSRRELIISSASLAFAAPARAQQFPIPGKPIRIVVPLTAGGQTDVQARSIAQKLTESLGVSVFVENKPGASTLIGTREVQRADPDGHTLLYTASILPQQYLYKIPPYDVLRDFTPVTTGSKVATILTAHVSMPFNTVPELVAYAKANPTKLNYASFGTGSASHLNGELLKRYAGIDMVHVPYKGASEAAKDLLAGNVQLFFDGPPTAMANVESGRVKLIAWAAETRATAFPNLPTLREQGFDIGRSGYLTAWGPAGMSPATVDKLYEHLAGAIRHPDLREVMAGPGSEVSALPPAEMAREARRLSDYWAGVIRELGVRLD